MCDGSSGPTVSVPPVDPAASLRQPSGSVSSVRPRTTSRTSARLAEQPAGGEQQRSQRLGVDQMRVVDDDDAWRLLRVRADQLQQLEADRDVAPRAQRIAAAAVAAEQLVGHREGHVGLGFVAARAQDPGGRQLREEALDERRLADAGLALHEQDLRTPGRCLGERIVEHPELGLPAHED